MSTMRMGFVPISVTVRSAGAMTHLVAQEPTGARDVSIAAIRPPCRAPQPADLQEVIMAASDRFEVPPEMRAFAEKSVEQARQAVDGFISAAHQAMSAFEGQAETARKGARDVTEKAMTFAERNIASAFAFAQDLVQARDLQEVLRLQADYIRQQMQALHEQAQELGESTSKAAKDAATPKS
jgi:phasin